MADEVDWQMWDHTAQLSSMIANSQRDPKKKKKPFKSNDFHPLLIAARRRRRKNAPITILKEVFVDSRKPT